MVKIKPRPRRTLPERPVIIQSGELALEGLYIEKKGHPLPALLNAPHPHFGGSMDSPVINELAYALARHEVATLRYNYRGIGASQGVSEAGEGEGNDMAAAIDFLVETFYPKKKGKVLVAGYSFGGWIALQQSMSDERLERLLLVAPPILKYDFNILPHITVPLGILVGNKDTICPLQDLTLLLDSLEKENRDWVRPPLYVVPHASHYFVRGLSEAGEAAAAFLTTGAFPEPQSIDADPTLELE